MSRGRWELQVRVSEILQIDEDGDEGLPPPTKYEKDNFLQ